MPNKQRSNIRRRRSYGYLAAGAALTLVAVGCSSSSGGSKTSSATASSSGSTGAKATAPGISSSTITIGMINDTTGVASSTFTDGVAAAQARVNMQNAQGGVDGRKLKLVVTDSQSSPTSFNTAAQDLVQQDGVFGVVSDSSFTFGGASYLTKANVPVTGSTFDGPEWGTAANMFTYTPPTYTNYNGTTYSYNNVSKLLQMAGAKKPAVLAFGISPSATLSAKQLVSADSQLGLSNCYLNLSVPFGGVDFTADVLQIKQAGCDAAVGTFTASSNVALASALKDAGLSDVKQFYYTSYAQSTLDSPAAEAALNGTYSEGLIATGNSASAQATQKFFNELKQWDPSYRGGLPDLGATNSWDSVDVMIEGLILAGPNPTRTTFESKLRGVTNYTIGGLTATPVSFDYLTGNLPAQECINAVVLQGSQFQPFPSNGAPICGQRVAYKV